MFVIYNQARGREDRAGSAGGTGAVAGQTTEGGRDEESNTGGLRDAVVCASYRKVYQPYRNTRTPVKGAIARVCVYVELTGNQLPR